MVQRHASVLGLRPEHEQTYRQMHAAVWPSVLGAIKRANIANYSIYLHDGLLFSYFEYHGDDFAADMALMAADPETQRWWAVMYPMQRPLEAVAPGDWWLPIDEVFHSD